MSSVDEICDALKAAKHLWNKTNKAMQEMRVALEFADQKLDEYRRANVSLNIIQIKWHSFYC